jgi:Tfp pilus assembly protein PilF
MGRSQTTRALTVVLGGLLGSFLFGSAAEAQTGSAYGRVVDEKGRPVLDARVDFDYQPPVARHYEAKTDKNGKFRLFLIHGGYDVRVSKEGYRPTGTGVQVSAGEASPISDIVIVSLAAATEAATESHPVLGPFKRATELAEAGRLDEARAIYEDLLKKDASVPEIHYNLATVYFRKKELELSAAEFQKVLELQPDHRGALVGLSRVYEDRGESGKALEAMARAAAAYPRDARIHYDLGVLRLNAKRLPEAKTAFERALELDPKIFEAHYLLATIALNQGDVPGANRHLERYLATAPADAPDRARATRLLTELEKGRR